MKSWWLLILWTIAIILIVVGPYVFIPTFEERMVFTLAGLFIIALWYAEFRFWPLLEDLQRIEDKIDRVQEG